MFNDDEDEINSDDGLQIVLETNKTKRKITVLDENEKEIVASVEKVFEETLEEKAAKANLSATNVKNIIKQVAMHEGVVAIVRNAENPEGNKHILAYEPKLTRAKAKELCKTTESPAWVPKKPQSEVHMLIGEDLQEDSSGDEYIPGVEDYDEDDFDLNSSTASVNTKLDNIETFLVPKDVLPNKSKSQREKDEEEANIALRTRSKLCLNATPLETIEGAFMPPDITTDMYDMDCDDDVWEDFLKTFTKPLDEVVKDDDECNDHDPEYNILADEEENQVDKEELRDDRAVTVSKKELNNLMAELLEYTDMYEGNLILERERSMAVINNKSQDNNDFLYKLESTAIQENFDFSNNSKLGSNETNLDEHILKSQIPLLAQQMRQHVQMLTQNFLLTYQHPDFYEMAEKFKRCLIDLKMSVEGKTVSMFNVENLDSALNVIEYWEKRFSNNSDQDIIKTKAYVLKVIGESIAAKAAKSEYIPTFPPLLMDVILNSDVFLYSFLLPRIPFKPRQTYSPYYNFTYHEKCLIALYLDKFNKSSKNIKRFQIRAFCRFLNKKIMTHVPVRILERKIGMLNLPRTEDNPIKQYFRNQKLPLCNRYVWPLDELKYLPLSKRNPETLPILWRNYLSKEELPPVQEKNTTTNPIIVEKKLKEKPIIISPILLCPTNLFGDSELINGGGSYRKILPKEIIFSPIDRLKKKKGRPKKRIQNLTEFNIITPIKEVNINNSVQSIPDLFYANSSYNISINMLPDMPNLEASMSNSALNNGNNKEQNSKNVSNNSQMNDSNCSNENLQDFSNIISKCSGNDSPKILENQQNQIEFCLPSTSTNNEGIEKDNLDDINELMIASSTVKTGNKKELSGAEKKRARLQREFLANLAMTTPEDPKITDEKDSKFVFNYYEKLSSTLEPDEYKNLLQILMEFDESTHNFINFYQTVQSILIPKYKELAEEFLLFLSNKQAYEVGELMNYFIIKDMSDFIKKLNIFFKDQPLQLKRLFKCLTDLTENPNLTIENVKTSISPFFKNNLVLKDWFLQLFPCERPSKMLTSLPYEVLDLSKEMTKQPEDKFVETIILPDTEDLYGGVNCICECHNENSPNKPKTIHCRKCGLKFMQGKTYVQNGKNLHPVNVTFPSNPDTDHLKRLNVAQRKRSESSPNKQLSPTKDHHDDIRNDEPDKSKKKSQLNNTKLPKKRKHRNNSLTNEDKLNNKHNNSNEKNKRGKSNLSSKTYKTTRKKRKIVKKTKHKKNNENSTPDSQLLANEEIIEQKIGSDQSLEYASDKLVESSQDNTNTEDSEYLSDTSNSSLNDSNNTDNNVTWSRDEDKIILETFQQPTNNEETFQYLSQILPNRTISEIKSRFRKLMALLQEMASNTAD